MKKILLFFVLFLAFNVSSFAQAPQGFKYQAVARDAGNNPYQNENIAVRVSLIRNGVSGIIDYTERHEITTTDLGVFDLRIGQGDVQSGVFEDIEWGSHSYYLKIDLDPDAGTNYVNMGTAQLMSVPYALYAREAGSGGGTDGDDDNTNELQTLLYDPETQQLSLTDGNTITLQTGMGGTDDQTLTLTGATLEIEGGNTVDLSVLQDGVDDADADPMNEMQSLEINGDQLSLSGSNTITLPNTGGGSDDQELTLTGTTLAIEGGNTVDLSAVQDGVNDADADPANELQTLTFDSASNELSLSNGGTIDLSALAGGGGGTDDQTLTLTGTEISIEGGNSIDLAGIIPPGGTDDQVLTLTGNMLSIEGGNSVDLSALAGGGGGTDDQELTLNGTEITIEGGNTIDLAGIIPPGGTDDQELTLTGTDLMIEGGNTIDLSTLPDAVDDADNDPMNEMQDITLSGNDLTITGGSTITLPSTGGGSDDQELTLTGTEISIEGGNTIDLAGIIPPGGTDDQELTLTGTDLMIEGGNTIDLSTLPDAVDDADNDPMNEMQSLEINGDQLSLSGGNTITLPSSGGGSDDQELTLTGTDLMIEGGNTVDLSAVQDGVDDADNDPMNEMQDITLSGNDLTISGGSTITLPSTGGGTDDQELTLTGTEISIEGGNTIDLAGIIPPGGTDDQELTLTGTDLMIEGGNTVDLSAVQDGVDDADNDPTNEVQDITLTGNELSISDGSTVTLPSSADDQTLTLTGTQISIEDGNSVDLSVLQDGVDDADNDPTNEVQDITLTGNELSISEGSTVTLPSSADDQTLTLTGTQISIEDGNSVDLSVLQDGVDDADNDPTNEVQDITLTGNQLSISEGSTVTLPSSADDQTLTLTGTQISIEDGNSVDLSVLQDGVNDADNDPANEIQSLTLTGNTLDLNNGGGSVDLSTVGASPIWSVNAADIFFDSGNVGINTTTPGELFQIDGGFNYAPIWLTNDASGTNPLADGGLMYLNAGGFMGFENFETEGIVFRTQALTRLRIMDDGNIGVNIGSTTPTAPLQVMAKSSVEPTENGLYVYNEGTDVNDDAIIAARVNGFTGAGGDPYISWDVEGFSGWSMGVDNSDSRKLKIVPGWRLSDPTNNPTAMTFHNNGNVNIGTETAHTEKLYIDGDIRVQDDADIFGLDRLVGVNDLRLYATDDGDEITDILISGSGNTTIGNVPTPSQLGVEGNFSVGGNYVGTAAPANGAIIEGNVGIGTTNPQSVLHLKDASSTEWLSVESGDGSGAALFGGPGFVNLSRISTFSSNPTIETAVYMDGDNTSAVFIPFYDNTMQLGGSGFRWTEVWATNGTIQTSDANLKENIQGISYGLSTVLSLNPVTWNWKQSEDRRTYVGFLAQEVEEILPEAVVKGEAMKLNGQQVGMPTESSNADRYGMRYTDFVPVLVKAVQEQQDIIDAQNEKIEQLEAQNAAFEARLQAIEAQLKK